MTKHVVELKTEYDPIAQGYRILSASVEGVIVDNEPIEHLALNVRERAAERLNVERDRIEIVYTFQ